MPALCAALRLGVQFAQGVPEGIASPATVQIPAATAATPWRRWWAAAAATVSAAATTAPAAVALVACATAAVPKRTRCPAPSSSPSFASRALQVRALATRWHNWYRDQFWHVGVRFTLRVAAQVSPRQQWRHARQTNLPAPGPRQRQKRWHRRGGSLRARRRRLDEARQPPSVQTSSRRCSGNVVGIGGASGKRRHGLACHGIQRLHQSAVPLATAISQSVQVGSEFQQCLT